MQLTPVSLSDYEHPPLSPNYVASPDHPPFVPSAVSVTGSLSNISKFESLYSSFRTFFKWFLRDKVLVEPGMKMFASEISNAIESNKAAIQSSGNDLASIQTIKAKIRATVQSVLGRLSESTNYIKYVTEADEIVPIDSYDSTKGPCGILSPGFSEATILHSGSKVFREYVGRGVMCFVYEKLYYELMGLLHTRADDDLYSALCANVFVRAEHLAADVEDPSKLESEPLYKEAVKVLMRLSKHRTPTEKVGCILRYADCINSAFAAAYGRTEELSADALIPFIIASVIQARPRDMMSQLRFVREFAPGDLLKDAMGYHLTCLESACAFGLDLGRNPCECLHMDHEEYAALTSNILIPRTVDISLTPPTTPRSPAFERLNIALKTLVSVEVADVEKGKLMGLRDAADVGKLTLDDYSDMVRDYHRLVDALFNARYFLQGY